MEALVDHAVRVRRASRLGREDAASAGAAVIDERRARWWRLEVSHAVERLPPSRLADAAFGGLQDSAPRAALLALNARVDQVSPDSWDHPDLVQIWFRWADYVVPRRDIGVFTVGTLPRDERHARALHQLADVVVAAIDGKSADSRRVKERLGKLGESSMMRASCSTGRVRIRWDARTVEVLAGAAPDIDAEHARRELARRFLHWYAPAGSAHFAKWAGVGKADAAATWDAIDGDITEVSYRGRKRYVLSSDLEAMTSVSRPGAMRLLPAGDPVLFMDDHPAPERRVPDPAAGITSRLVNSLTGRIVAAGDVVGAWGRVKGDVTLDPWPGLGAASRADVELEAQRFEAALGHPVRIRWLEPRS